MKRLFLLLLIAVIAFPFFPKSSVAAEDNCAGINLGQTIYWEGVPLKPGQIGKVTTLKDTQLLSFDEDKIIEVKTLPKGNTYRIYNFKTDYLGVGGGFYIRRDPNMVTYKTPSKEKLLALRCANPSVYPAPQDPPVQPENLGPQVSNFSTIASRAGMDHNGNAYLYITLQGTPASLAVVDLNNNTIHAVHALANSTTAWALDIDRDGILWIGGTTSGDLYSYNPDTDELKDYGSILDDATDTSIQDLVVDDQYVYCSTAYGANVVVFNKQTGKKEVILPTGNGKIAKSIAIDSANQVLYASSGPSADLFKWDLATKTRVSIITDTYRSDTYTEKMKMIDHYLALKFYPSKRSVLYDAADGSFQNEFSADSRGFSPKDVETNEFYYTWQGNFYSYNLENGVIRNTMAMLPNKKTALSLDFVSLKDDPSQKWLTGIIDNNGNYYLYNPATNKVIIKTMTLPTQSVPLNIVFSDPALNYIFSNGYMTGGLTQYDPQTQTQIQLGGINQWESALFVNGKLYGGAYPSARLIEVTPQESWDQSSERQLLNLSQYGQERITSLAASGDHLFAGTYSQNSTKGGLLLDYDLNSGSYQIYEDYVTNQSIITLYNDGQYIYGGTSIHANYQVANFKAKLFRFDPAHPDKPEFLVLPVQAVMVMSLIKGPDGDIWGAADGTIFAYNPNKNRFRKVKLLKAISGRFSNATLIAGKDGYIYGTIEGRLFKINPADMSYKILLESGAYQLAQDANGNLYYKNGANLYRYPLQK